MGRVRSRFFTCLAGTILALALPTSMIHVPDVDGVATAQAMPLDAGLLPADKFFEAWSKSGRPKVFTKADLYGRIDGGAEAFLEIGFDQLLVQQFRTAPAGPEIVVEIYRMSDATAARGIYLSKCGAEKRDPSFRERHTVNRYQLMFQRDRYFVIVGNASGKETLQPTLVKFGGALAARMPADGPVAVLDLLEKRDLVAGSERIMRGAFGLQAVYTLGEGDVLQLGGKLAAAAGDYKIAGLGAITKIIVTYPTPAAATSALRNIKARLDSYLKPTLSTNTRLVFRDFEKKYGSVQLDRSRIEILLHMTVEPK
ncbi:MAG: hypothetical protein NT151_08955 [Acidobacteria bacterium]|nr:hypothetical protein [Acidobacteriota bacterium]